MIVEAGPLDLVRCEEVPEESKEFQDSIYWCGSCRTTSPIEDPCHHYYWCNGCDDGFPVDTPCWCVRPMSYMKKLIYRLRGHDWDTRELSRECSRCGRYEVAWWWKLMLST